MRQIIKIGKIEWVVAEPEATSNPDPVIITVIGEKDLEKAADWLLGLKLPKVNLESWIPEPTPQSGDQTKPKPNIEVGDGAMMLLHVVGAVLQVFLIVLGSVAQVIGASMAESICW